VVAICDRFKQAGSAKLQTSYSVFQRRTLENVKETVATLWVRCHTRIMIEQTRRPVARFSAAGFSLLELFLVAVIIFIVFTLFLSSGSKSYQEKKLAECQGHLQSIYAALMTFSQDNNGALPAVPGAQTSEAPLSLLVPKYTTGSEFFICPGGKDKPLPDAQPFADRKISYADYMGRTLQDGSEAPLVSDAQVDTAPKMPGQIVFSPTAKSRATITTSSAAIFFFATATSKPLPPGWHFPCRRRPTSFY